MGRVLDLGRDHVERVDARGRRRAVQHHGGGAGAVAQLGEPDLLVLLDELVALGDQTLRKTGARS